MHNVTVGLPASRRASQAPYANATTAPGQAAIDGRSEASNDNAADIPSPSNRPVSQRDGRHSSRQVADVLDQGGKFDIGGSLVAHEPLPELIVLTIQQA